MMHALRELERVEWRVLGALRFVDGTTGVPVDRSFNVIAPGASLLRNRSGLYVIREWEELAEHAAEFLTAPGTPETGSKTLRLSISDPLGEYLPVAAQVLLPRNGDPAQINAPDSLFRPAEIALYPSSRAPVSANWSVLRVTVTDTVSGDALGGVLLRVRLNGVVLARGLTDWRGEALVPVVGVPVTTFSDDEDAVVVSESNVTLEAGFDPAIGSRTPMARVRAGKSPAALPLVDPKALDDVFDTLVRGQDALSIAARRSQSVDFSINLP